MSLFALNFYNQNKLIQYPTHPYILFYYKIRKKKLFKNV
jgi:hypothetical protein